tara:strand:- start:112 stop:723 length:612 start_codon:yes stop_codon:yes gene_type:complete
MSFILAGAVALKVGIGAAKAIKGAQQKKQAKAEAEKAKAEMEARKKEYAQLDTSNVYKDLENKLEDLTINQKEAEMQNQENRQNQSQILNKMNKAAGGSGIAALAQSMANANVTAVQKASASIGEQEAANQKAAAEEASNLQEMERDGEQKSREMTKDKVGTLLGMAQQEVAGKNEEIAAADKQMWSGVTDIGEAGMSAMGGV